MKHTYPFRPGPIDTKDAVDFICDVVYPFPKCSLADDEREHRRAAIKRIREHLRRDKKGITGRINDPEAFFTWAIKQKAKDGPVKSWAALLGVQGLPHNEEEFNVDYEHVATLGFKPCSPDRLPQDRDALAERYRFLYALYEEKRTESAEKIRDLERKLAESEAKRRHHRKKSRKMGAW